MTATTGGEPQRLGDLIACGTAKRRDLTRQFGIAAD